MAPLNESDGTLTLANSVGVERDLERFPESHTLLSPGLSNDEPVITACATYIEAI